MPLPTFIIAGERKCGTTALHHWMSRHPDVYVHPHWDMNYFLDDKVIGREWTGGEVDDEDWERTHSLDDYAGLFCDGEGRKAIGEKTADLFYWKPAHRRLARYLPEGRFIIVLRNPADRAWSHYWNELGKKGRETLSFEDAIAAEEERSSVSAYARNHFSYLTRGFYEVSLRALYRHVAASRVLILTTEQMLSRPADALRTVYRFIGVDPDLGLELAGTRHNENATQLSRTFATWRAVSPIANIYNRITAGLASRLTGNGAQASRLKLLLQTPFRRQARKISMPNEIRQRLLTVYEPHVRELESMLGRPIEEWKPAVDPEPRSAC